MNTAVMQKPPLAPKPKVIQPPRTCLYSTPKRDGLSQVFLSTPVRVKPDLAPKPFKLLLRKNGLHQTIAKDAQTPSEMSTRIGHLNSRNGESRQENKKPDWDCIIPVCPCSQKNCSCARNSILAIDKIERDWKTSHSQDETPVSRVKPVPKYKHRENRGGNKCPAVHDNTRNSGTSLSDVRAQAVEAPTDNQPLYSVPLEATPIRNKLTQTNGHILTVSDAISREERRGPAGSIVTCKDTDKPDPRPAVFRKPLPMPRQSRTLALVKQESLVQARGGVERCEEKDRAEGRQGMEVPIREVKKPAERKSHPSPSVSEPTGCAQDILGSGSSTCERRTGLRSPMAPGPAPVTPAREKACLSEPETRAHISTSCSQHFPNASLCPNIPQDVNEDELEWVDDSVYDLELSVDTDGETREKADGGGGTEKAEEIYCKYICHPLSASLTNRTELHSDSPVTVASSGNSEEDVDTPEKMSSVPDEPKRHSYPAASLLKKELSGEGHGEGGKTSHSCEKGGVTTTVIKDDRSPRTFKSMRELPVTPGDNVAPGMSSILQTPMSLLPGNDGNTGNKETIGLPTITQPKTTRFSLGKNKSKSFSSADLVPADRHKRNSFLRLLDRKISVKKLAKLPAKEANREAGKYVDGEGRDECLRSSPDVEGSRKFSCPHLSREQSVDGDEFYYPGAEHAVEVEYENVPYYDEIPDYLPLGSGLRGGGAGVEGMPAEWLEWAVNLHDDDDDDNIYEEQEPYHHHLEEHTELQEQPSGRSSIDEDNTQIDDGQSDDDIMVHSSDEDDGSSSSSKGEPEQSVQSEADRAAMKSKTVHIAREIMSSENVFVNVLKLLHVDFRDAVVKASPPGGKPVVEERVLNQILYYLPQLYELNQDLLRELEERVEHWESHGRLADVFVKKGPYLKMYSTYIREFDKNVALLDEQSRKNQAFGAVIREFEATPRCANLALKHYLLKPVQRIPQYQLLLTDYLKNLSPDSADYKDTLAALGIMKEVANHANDSMKQGDNFQKLIRVQCSLNGHPEIVVPGRVFLKEGVLMKLSRKVMQPRMFFLFNDTLLYTIPVQSGQFKLNNMLSLAGMKVSKPSQEAFQNELTIESVERSFILSASSAVERDGWLEAISTAIKDYTRKKISFISNKSLEEMGPEEISSGPPLGSKAPIWIPDLRATMCMVCTCEFSLTWRRHHCRACGKVVCQSCSSNKHGLEYLKNQLARVCDHCCVILQQQKNVLTPSPTLSPGGKPSFGFTRKTKRIPAALKEVTANTDNSSMSGYLQRSKGNKKQGKRLWFVIKNKVLYTYAASEDVAALESQPLLGFMLKEEKEGPTSQMQQFKLYHKNTLHYVFKADNSQTAQRWIDAFREATVL